MFRVIVQDSRLTPTSGKIVASLGNYDPHAQVFTLDKDKAAFYLEHGAQPSDRIARLLKNEGVKLPSWVSVSADKARDIRNPDKRRSTRPAEPVVEVTAEVVAVAEPVVEEATPVVEEVVTEVPAVEETPEVATEVPAEEPTPEVVAEEAPTEEAVPKA